MAKTCGNTRDNGTHHATPNIPNAQATDVSETTVIPGRSKTNNKTCHLQIWVARLRVPSSVEPTGGP
eukprot:6621866-Pyramimonas_sp.AAC.1